MDQNLIQKFVHEIGTLRVELLHRDNIIEQLRAKIAELENKQNTEEI